MKISNHVYASDRNVTPLRAGRVRRETHGFRPALRMPRWAVRALLCGLPGLMATLWCTGCATPSGPDESKERQLEFILETEPSGVDVYVPGENDQPWTKLGTTPLSFPLTFERVQAGWRPQTPAGTPLMFDEVDDESLVHIPNLGLYHPDYEPQNFTHSWRFPVDLRRDGSPVERQKRVSVHMERPVMPQHRIDITLQSPAPDTRLHAVAEDGTVGRLVGMLPLSFEVGFAPVRSSEGEPVQWLRWNIPDYNDMWEHTDEGDLLFSGYVVREGYEPLGIWQRRIARASSERGTSQAVTIPLQALRPAQPEAHFTLKVDSLPTGAAVYPLRDDGALGRKLGETPFTLSIGLGQELAEPEPGAFIHHDWLIWPEADIVRWATQPDGSAVFYLYCALYQEDYAVENVTLPIFNLEPGQPWPTEAELNIPLLTHEQQAVRDAREIRQAPPNEEGYMQRNPLHSEHNEPSGFVWQTPDTTPEDKGEAGEEKAGRDAP